MPPLRSGRRRSKSPDARDATRQPYDLDGVGPVERARGRSPCPWTRTVPSLITGARAQRRRQPHGERQRGEHGLVPEPTSARAWEFMRRSKSHCRAGATRVPDFATAAGASSMPRQTRPLRLRIGTPRGSVVPRSRSVEAGGVTSRALGPASRPNRLCRPRFVRRDPLLPGLKTATTVGPRVSRPSCRQRGTTPFARRGPEEPVRRRADGALVFSKHRRARFPEEDEVVALLARSPSAERR